MAFTLDRAVPWGRSLAEYAGMFDLTEDDLGRRILGCGDGPASFNAEMDQRGHRVVSFDPVYQFTAAQIKHRVIQTYDVIMEQLRPNAQNFVWDVIRSPEALGRIRMTAMRTFLADYDQGKREGRYVAAALPSLPFGDGQFDLALCSHFLFLYSDHLPFDFHCAAIREMCRAAEEVRIFPLLDLAGRESPYVEAGARELERASHRVEIQQVPYEFRRGSNRNMRVWA
jgi:hypothetical protein